MNSRDDQALLVLTTRGDDGAARELWARWGSRLIAFATVLLRRDGGHAAACDVVQGVFCRILSTDRATIAAVKDVGSWLAGAVRNESLNYIRASERRRVHTAASAGSIAGQGAAFDDVREALEALPEALREIVLLKHAAGLTFDQIALALNDNRNTIASRYGKAVKLMRDFAAAGQVVGPPAGVQEVRT
jgi:RNA polymerase sigma factor (sigma-70 family)